MTGGWIKLYRQLLEKPIWQESTPEQKVILITLLSMANHEEKEWEWQGEPYKASPGQFVTSLESIKRKCGKGISMQNVRTALKRFEKYEFLTNKPTNKKMAKILSRQEYAGGKRIEVTNVLPKDILEYATQIDTNFHKGGDMIVNDQPGPLYKEIVHEPGKEPYIPVGRNVLIPNAKRGTKVYKASRTKSIMRRLGIPKYADGVGIPEDSTLVRNLKSVTNNGSQEAKKSEFSVNFDNSIFEDMLRAINQLGSDMRNLKIIMKEKEVADIITDVQNRKDISRKRMAGELL
ncbi:hypothetical protein [Enterococcus sp.]|uniref:hypothetical protein n=1 Tax=Enterococcus sp. TaxID=35783 RepID=UPI0028B07FD3|nr:hypothetical protein [Enterococcus sp.]